MTYLLYRDLYKGDLEMRRNNKDRSTARRNLILTKIHSLGKKLILPPIFKEIITLRPPKHDRGNSVYLNR